MKKTFIISLMDDLIHQLERVERKTRAPAILTHAHPALCL